MRVSVNADVLLVDDDPVILDDLVTTLEPLAVTLDQTTSGEEALEILGTDKAIKAVVSDVDMPRTMDGIELCRQIKQAHPGMPVILRSGNWNEARKEEACRAGAYATFDKTDRPEALVAVVRRAIAPLEP